VAIYVRVSTEEQRERQSFATQKEFAEKYCDLHHLSVSQVYADNGVSGTVAIEDRGEGCRILADQLISQTVTDVEDLLRQLRAV
jgi:site-specific DNA recombinase